MYDLGRQFASWSLNKAGVNVDAGIVAFALGRRSPNRMDVAGKNTTRVSNVGAILKTNAEAKTVAEKLGFKKTKFTSDGQAVFFDGKYYITRDVTGHKGGAFKGATSVEALGSKTTRTGTFDINMKRIGD
jgi:hypothetical protein